MPDKPHTASGKAKVRVNCMIDPDLKARAIAANVNFSEALAMGVERWLSPASRG